MGGAEFGLGLSFEDGLLDAHTQRTDQTLSDVLGRKLLLVVKLLHHAGIVFAEGALVGAALGGVLSVDE